MEEGGHLQYDARSIGYAVPVTTNLSDVAMRPSSTLLLAGHTRPTSHESSGAIFLECMCLRGTSAPYT